MRPDVVILLCTCQGAEHLPAQLASYHAQRGVAWRLVVSDDGSTDATRELAAACRGPAAPTVILDGPSRGFAANFMQLTEASALLGDEMYFAWSDQDDVWLPDKLSRALEWLNVQPQDRPALYCGRTLLVDAADKFLGYSPLFRRPPSFANALCQSLAGGNTMVFNRAARELLCRALPVRVVSHDWWIYLLVSGHGGMIRYDPVPTVRYRQHGSNLVGSNHSLRAQWRRFRQLLAGEFRRRDGINLAALEAHSDLLTTASRAILHAFRAARQARSRGERLCRLRQAGIHRQSRLHTAALHLAAVLDRYP